MRIVKFSLVGAIGIGLQLAVLNLLNRCGTNYLVATGLAVEAAVLHNFCWHRRLTWADRKTAGWVSCLWRFHISNASISLIGNLLLMRVLVGVFRIPVMLGNTIAIGTCALVNYLASDRWVFMTACEE